MGMHRLALVFALAGCPAPSRYVIADVTAARVPLPGALVATDCGAAYNPAQRTDEDGRARVRMFEGTSCSLLVAKPGYPTVVTGPVSVCPAGTCPPTQIDLTPNPNPRPARAPTPTEREYALPTGPRPMEVAQ